MTDDQFDKMLAEFGQKVSFDFGDMVSRYPRVLLPIALAVVSCCIAAQVATLPKTHQMAYEKMKKECEILTLPPEFDPRKS